MNNNLQNIIDSIKDKINDGYIRDLGFVGNTPIFPIQRPHDRQSSQTKELQRMVHLAIGTLKRAYRKHVRDDELIGWSELENELCNTLCEIIGDDAFQEFCKEESND